MDVKVLAWFKENLMTRRGWGVFLTAFVPIALVIGRSPADIAVSIVAILFFIDSILRHQWGWVKKPWILAALLLWGYSVVRAAFIPDGGVSLYTAFVWLRYIVFAASMAEWALAEEKGRLWLLYASLYSVLFLSVDGIFQYVFRQDILGNKLFNDARLTSVYQRPILGITIANLFAPAVFWLLKQEKTYKSVLLANVCFAAVFLSGDRMGFIFAACILLPWLFFLLRNSTQRFWIIAANVCFFALLLLFSPNLTKRQIHSTMATAGEITTSPYGLVWKSALKVGAENPLFGVGIRQFRYVCPNERFGPLTYKGDERCYSHPHNPYMEWFSEGGLVGLFGFVGFALTVGLGLWRRLKVRDVDLVLWGLSAMILMRLMPFVISTSFFNNWSAIPFWLALGWAMSYKPEAKTSPP